MRRRAKLLTGSVLMLLLSFSLVIAADNPQDYVQKGDEFLKKLQFDEAKTEYQKAWKLNNALEAILRVRLGVLYAQQQRWVEAEEEFSLAAQDDPNNIMIHFNLANVYSAMVLPDKAIKEYETILKLNPNLDWAQFNLSTLYYKEKDNIEKAVIHCKKAIELNSNMAPAHFHLGKLYEDIHMTEEALEEYNKAISLDPKHTKAHYNIGVLKMRDNQLDEAISYFEKAIELDKNFVEPYINIGAIHLNREEPEKAIPILEKAAEIDPNQPVLLVNLAVAYRNTKQFDQAMVLAQKASDLGYRPAKNLINSIRVRKEEAAKDVQAENQNPDIQSVTSDNENRSPSESSQVAQ